MEGTLSLFDWRPSAPATPAPTEAASSVPPVPPVPPVEPAAAPGPRIIVFDCETTGIDFTRDQVIELCVQHGLGDPGMTTSRTWRIKPSVPIHPAAQAVHGITMADLAACPSFAEYADEIATVFAAADVIVGYNLSFDIDMIQAEYSRIGRPLLDLSNKKIVDAFRLWQQCEPRSLTHAHRRFVGDEFAAAHSASADVAATGRVLVGMLQHFKLADQDWTQIAQVCDPGRASWVGPSRHLRWENEIIVLGFGKHAGAALHELASGPDRSFLQWVTTKDFPPHVMEICKAALERTCDELHTWVRQRYGQPAPTAQPPFVTPPPSPAAAATPDGTAATAATAASAATAATAASAATAATAATATTPPPPPATPGRAGGRSKSGLRRADR